MSRRDLPHPVTGQIFPTPVPPGTGWPQDPATPDTRAARSPSGVVRLAARASLPELEARITVCRACPRLVGWREDLAESGRAAYDDQPYWGRPVPPFGSPTPRVLVVGLAPAAHGGNRTGRNFTGDRSADHLHRALHAAGLATQPTSRHAGDGQVLLDARLTNPVRCVPPGDKPTADERETCSPWLRRELSLVLPTVRVVVCLGAIGWVAFWTALDDLGLAVPRPRPRFGHGAEVPVDASPVGGSTSLVVLGCYHPSPRNTSTGVLSAAMLDDVFARAASLGGDRVGGVPRVGVEPTLKGV